MVGYSHTKCGKWKVQVNRHAQTQNMWHWHHPGCHWHRGWYPNVIIMLVHRPRTNKESNIDFLQIRLFVPCPCPFLYAVSMPGGMYLVVVGWTGWVNEQRGGLISLVEQGDFAATWEVRETWSSTRDLPSVGMKWDESCCEFWVVQICFHHLIGWTSVDWLLRLHYCSHRGLSPTLIYFILPLQM